MTFGLPDSVRNAAFRWHKAVEAREHRLSYLFFEVTRRCNLSCLHCGSDCKSESSLPELSLASWVSLMAYVKQQWDPFIVVTGGEPLVRRDLPQLTAALGDQGLRWGMVTNGLLLTPDRFAVLADHGLSSLTVSLDGNRGQHTLIRRHPRAYDGALRAIRLLGASRLEHKDVVTCVHPANLDHLDDVAEVLVDAGITSWRLFRIFPRGQAARHPELLLTFDQSRRMLEWIRSRRAALLARGLTLDFSCEGYLPFALDRQVRREPFFCRSGVNIASILCDGTITGCNNNGPEFAQGRVGDDDLAEVWEHRFAEYRRRTWMRQGPCAACSHWKDCHGSSIHLRDKTEPGPLFCYLKDLQS